MGFKLSIQMVNLPPDLDLDPDLETLTVSECANMNTSSLSTG